MHAAEGGGAGSRLPGFAVRDRGCGFAAVGLMRGQHILVAKGAALILMVDLGGWEGFMAGLGLDSGTRSRSRLTLNRGACGGWVFD